jgi:hypothetical protein
VHAVQLRFAFVQQQTSCALAVCRENGSNHRERRLRYQARSTAPEACYALFADHAPFWIGRPQFLGVKKFTTERFGRFVEQLRPFGVTLMDSGRLPITPFSVTQNGAAASIRKLGRTGVQAVPAIEVTTAKVRSGSYFLAAEATRRGAGRQCTANVCQRTTTRLFKETSKTPPGPSSPRHSG